MFLQQKQTKKEQEESFGGDGNAYHLDCGDSFMGIGISPNSSNCIH